MDFIELVSYGIHKQDFYVIVKIDEVYVLLVTIPIPYAEFCEEEKILNHIKEFFVEGYKYKGFFGRLENAMEKLSKI